MAESSVRPRVAGRRRKNVPAYSLIARGADGRPSIEQFSDAEAYRDRVVALRRGDDDALSIDDLVSLLVE